MNKQELAKHIENIEASIRETDNTIKEARSVSEFMVEPLRSYFVSQLEDKEIQLNISKVKLEQLKMLLERRY